MSKAADAITTFVGHHCLGCEARRRKEQTYWRVYSLPGSTEPFESHCVACHGVVGIGAERPDNRCRECRRELIGQLGTSQELGGYQD